MFSIQARLMFGFVMLCIMIIIALFLLFVAVDVAHGFGTPVSNVLYNTVPSILLIVFLAHTMFSARDRINELEGSKSAESPKLE